MSITTISKKWYGKNSPVLALDDMNGDETFVLPEYKESPTPEEILKMVVGESEYFDLLLLTPHIKMWFKEIDLYLDVPLLGCLSEIDINALEWWEKIVKINGFMIFLNKIKYTRLEESYYFLNLCGKTGNIEFCKWVIKSMTFNESSHEHCYTTMLRSACENGYIECVKWCIQNGAKPEHGVKPACQNGYLDIAKLCINDNVRFDEPFVSACKYGHFECAKWCIEQGANEDYGHVVLDYFNNESTLQYRFIWALTYACANDYQDCVKLCLENLNPEKTQCLNCKMDKHINDVVNNAI
jgi:hypothetical protein